MADDDVYDHIMAVDDLILLRSLAVHVSSVEQFDRLRSTEKAEEWAEEDGYLEAVAHHALVASIVCSELTQLITSAIKSGGQCVARTSKEVHEFLQRVAHSPLVAASAPGILQEAATAPDGAALEDYARRIARIQRAVDCARPRRELLTPAPVDGIPTGGEEIGAVWSPPSEGSYQVRGPHGAQ